MTEIATFASGCFWCTEAVFTRLKGVTKVTSGYTGGAVDAPAYEQVSTGETGHAEAVQIEFDPEVIKYAQLLDVFWGTHDPTTMNRQGADVGTQYRSEIFYHSPEQKEIAEKSKLDAQASFDNPIVTAITQFTNFYPAEEYHKNYYEEHPDQAYCQVVISPKIQKLREKYKMLLKYETN